MASMIIDQPVNKRTVGSWQPTLIGRAPFLDAIAADVQRYKYAARLENRHSYVANDGEPDRRDLAIIGNRSTPDRLAFWGEYSEDGQRHYFEVTLHRVGDEWALDAPQNAPDDFATWVQ